MCMCTVAWGCMCTRHREVVPHTTNVGIQNLEPLHPPPGLSPNLFNGFHGAVHMSLYERLVRWQRQRSARAADDPLPWRETVSNNNNNM